MNMKRMPTGFKRIVAMATAVALTLGAIIALASGEGRDFAQARGAPSKAVSDAAARLPSP